MLPLRAQPTIAIEVEYYRADFELDDHHHAYARQMYQIAAITSTVGADAPFAHSSDSDAATPCRNRADQVGSTRPTCSHRHQSQA